MNRKLNAILFFNFLAILSSCNGRNTHQVFDTQNSAITIGDTVKELGKNLMHVYQDKKNIYWFGSSTEGVYRYDPSKELRTGGKNIIHFTTKDGLPHNKIEKIQEDQSGSIYFNTAGGISKFDGQRFTTLKVTSHSNEGWKLEPDDQWFKGAQDSGVVYRYDGKTLHRLKFPKTKPGEEFISKYPRSEYPNMSFNPYDVYSIYKDTKGYVWFGSGTLGVCRYDGKSFNWISEDDVTELDDGAANGVRSIIEDKDGKFWFSNTQYRYDIYPDDSENHDVSIMSYSREKSIGSLDGKKDGTLDFYISITKDNNDNLWIATYDDGVWRYDGQNLTHYPVKEGDKIVTVFTIYKDNNGDLWLGTHENGVYKFNGSAFERFRP